MPFSSQASLPAFDELVDYTINEPLKFVKRLVAARALAAQPQCRRNPYGQPASNTENTNRFNTSKRFDVHPPQPATVHVKRVNVNFFTGVSLSA